MMQVEVNRGGVAGAGEAGFDPDAIGERFRYVVIFGPHAVGDMRYHNLWTDFQSSIRFLHEEDTM